MSKIKENVANAVEQKATQIKSVPAEQSFIEGKLIKAVQHIKSQFGDKMQTMLIVKTKNGLERFYINQNFWDKSEQPALMDNIMLTIEHRIIGVTTYNQDGEVKVYGAEAPAELKGNTVLTVASIDNVDEVASISRKKATGNITAFLSLSDDELARLGKAGLSIS